MPAYDSIPVLLTIKEAAEFLREPFNTTRARVYNGTLRSVPIGKRGRRVKRADLLAFVSLTPADFAAER